MQMRQSFLFLSTTSLLALTGVPAFAFSISGPLSRQPLPSFQKVNYSSNGQTGIIEVKTKNYAQLSPLAPSIDNFLQTLRHEYRNSPGDSGITWNFTAAQQELTGGFYIGEYYACAPNVGYPCGSRVGITGNQGVDPSQSVGSALSLFYSPGVNDPVVDSNLHWIQVVTAKMDERRPVEKVDNDSELPFRIPPYYQNTERVNDSQTGTPLLRFLDTPQRMDVTKNWDWSALLYLVKETTDPGNPKTKNVTVYNGIEWGWTSKFTPPKTSKTFSGTLASGYQTDYYSLDKLTPGSTYTAWTNNDLPSNRCNPNTFLRTYSSASGSYLWDDNSSPVGNGFASGLTGTVGTSGTVNLAVFPANGGARGQDKGNYELFVNVYEPNSPTFSNGNSGGGGFGKEMQGGFGKEMRGLTQQNPILPTSVQNGWQIFSQVPGCRWYDPYTTYGFEFQSLEDTLFTEILDFPVGDDTEFAVTVGNVLLGTFGPGSSVDFVSLLGHGVSNFKITDINSLFGSTAETAFPIQLAFNEREGSFKMRAISADDAENVPEPTTVLGTLLAVGGLGTIKKLKNRKTKE